MDERHALTAARYIETNPVRAGLVARAEEWAWSSAKAHLEGKDDGLAKVEPLLAMVGDWGLLLAAETAAEDAEAMRRHERTGRPLGEEGFIGRLEESLSRRLRRGKPGPKAATQKR
jgi:putative transposase